MQNKTGTLLLASFTFLTLNLFAARSFAAATPVKSPPQSATGIPIDSDWKKLVYEFAQKNVKHPAWGFAHSERDFQVAKILAAKEGFSLDEDVLFACAFLHDIGGLAAFEKKDVDHAVRSVEVIEPLLQQWGFPMAKWPQVKDMILGHTYYTPAPTSRDVLAFRDADILDFLGNIGVARILAVTEEDVGTTGVLGPNVGTLKDFAKTMAAKCSLAACKEMAKPRQIELENFLLSLDQESFQGRAL